MITRSNVLISLLAVICALAACSSSDTPSGTETAGAPGGGSAGASGHGGSSAAGASRGGANPSAGAGAAAGNAGQAQGGAGAAAGGDATGGHAGAAGASGEGAAGSGEAGSGDAGASGQGGAPDSEPQVAYLGTILNGLIPLSVDPVSGVPSLLQGGPILPNEFVAALAVDPQQRFLYVADENKHVDTFAIAADGKLPTQATFSVPITTAGNLNTLAIDPKGRFVYVGSVFGSAIFVFQVDPTTGKLEALGNPIQLGTADDPAGANYIAPDPSGHFLYVSQGFKLGVRGFSVSETGKLEELAGSPFAATGAHTVFGGALVFEPTGHFLYSAGGGLLGFKVDATSGKLELLTGAPFSDDIGSDSDANSIAIDPQGKYLYAAHFLGTNHVVGFEIDPSDGSLAEVPGSPEKLSQPYSVAVDRTGRFLYAANDGPDGLAVYSIKRSDGSFEQIQATSPGINGLEPVLTFASLH